MKKYFFVYIWPVILAVSVILFFIEKAIESSLFAGNQGMNIFVRLLILLVTLGVFLGTIGTFIIGPIVLVVTLVKNNKSNPQPTLAPPNPPPTNPV